MDTNRSPSTLSLPGVPLPNGLMVVFGPHGGAVAMLDLVAHLSLLGPLYMLDCGNRSNMYRIAKTLRYLSSDPAANLKNIRLSRAFTCYQVVALLDKLASNAMAPVVILDLLSTFMDESIHVAESRLLFESAMDRILQFSQLTPVVVSARPLLSISSPRSGLLQRLREGASQIWEECALPQPAPAGAQLSLFAD